MLESKRQAKTDLFNQISEFHQESEEKYFNLMENAPDGIILIDRKGVIQSVNKAFCSLSGFEEKDFVGKFFLKVPTLLLQDLSFFLDAFRRIIKGEFIKPFEFKYRHKNGTVRKAEAHVSLMRN